MKTFVLGINGSPHNDGTTAKLVKEFLKESQKNGCETKLINLSDLDMKPCLGCYSKRADACKYPCNQKDELTKLFPLFEKADAIAFATPVYWFNMSGLMKTLMDRFCCMAAHGYKLENKIAVCIAASKENEGGRASASISMAAALNHLGFFIPPYGIMFYPGIEKIVKKGKIVDDEWIHTTIKDTSKNIIPLSNFLKKSKLVWY